MANQASNYTIGANDEHGLNPPTAGKRTPIMPYLNRSIYENEFNRAAKNYFLEACLRTGFNVYDVKPEIIDISVRERINRVNLRNITLLITFGYNAFGTGVYFNEINGFVVAWSSLNMFADESRALSEDIYLQLEASGLKANSEQDLDIGVLSQVRCPSSLVEPGFMTNYVEAARMLDPDFQILVADSTCRGVCDHLNVQFVERDSLSAYPVLRQGDRGGKVTLLQLLLNDYGANLIPDGVFGQATTDALKAFQTKNGLTPDGIAGGQVYRALLNLNPLPRLKLGDTGAQVTYLQNKLLSKLYPVTVDGIFGEQTKRALENFQRENNLPVTGEADEASWSFLIPPTYIRPRLF